MHFGFIHHAVIPYCRKKCIPDKLFILGLSYLLETVLSAIISNCHNFNANSLFRCNLTGIFFSGFEYQLHHFIHVVHACIPIQFSIVCNECFTGDPSMHYERITRSAKWRHDGH